MLFVSYSLMSIFSSNRIPNLYLYINISLYTHINILYYVITEKLYKNTSLRIHTFSFQLSINMFAIYKHIDVPKLYILDILYNRKSSSRKVKRYYYRKTLCYLFDLNQIDNKRNKKTLQKIQ